MCHKKYGADWPKYKKRVPYAFFPFSIVPSTVEGTQMLWSFLTFYLATFGAVTLLVPGKAAEFVFADGFITDNPDTLMVGLQVYALVNVVVALLVAAVGHDGGPTQGQLVAAAAGQLFLAVFLAWTYVVRSIEADSPLFVFCISCSAAAVPSCTSWSVLLRFQRLATHLRQLCTCADISRGTITRFT